VKKTGWRKDSYRHSLASRGVRTSLYAKKISLVEKELKKIEINPPKSYLSKEDEESILNVLEERAKQRQERDAMFRKYFGGE
jgi:hypothetical protein